MITKTIEQLEAIKEKVKCPTYIKSINKKIAILKSRESVKK